MADWATSLGLSLGGDSEKEYEEGRALGARTEDALAQARERVNKNAAQARAKDDLVRAGVPENIAQAAATSQAAGGSFEDPIKLLIQNQTFGFNRDVADPNVPLDRAQRIKLAQAPGPVEQFYKVGGGYGNKFNSGAGVTPLGASLGTDGGGQSAALQLIHEIETREQAARGDPNFHLSPAQAMGIARETQKVTDIGGVPGIIDLMSSLGLTGWDHGLPNRPPPGGAPGAAPAPTAPAAIPTTPTAVQVAPVDQVASNKGNIAAATEQGQAQGRNAASLPTALNTIDSFSHDIDNLLAAPGFDSIYGARVANPVIGGVVQFASQDASNADALRSKVNAESFRASINSMRGLGQLSNAEGEKVQAALTILANPKIEPALARQAAQDLKVHLAELRRVAQIEAGQHAATAPGTTPAAAPQGRVKMIGGRKFVETAPGQWAEDDGA